MRPPHSNKVSAKQVLLCSLVRDKTASVVLWLTLLLRGSAQRGRTHLD